jgi:isocitrate/isopropylmalate dehydrogenase
MFKEELDAAARRHPRVRYEPQLIDATYALLLVKAGEALVIPALNRDGDCLSDLVLQMFGSIAGSESMILSFDQDFNVKTVIAEAPHGTAPVCTRRTFANPLAMILAARRVTYVGSQDAERASRAIYESALEAIYDGVATSDLGGSASTSDFTDEVINRVTRKLEVWGTLG